METEERDRVRNEEAGGVDGSTPRSGVSCPTESLCVASYATGSVAMSADPTGGASAWTTANVDGPTWIKDLYTNVLRRTADPSGVTYWTGVEATHGRVAVARAIDQSVESRIDRATALYSDLLHRAPDAGGLAHWMDALPRLGDRALARHLADSAECFTLATTRFP